MFVLLVVLFILLVSVCVACVLWFVLRRVCWFVFVLIMSCVRRPLINIIVNSIRICLLSIMCVFMRRRRLRCCVHYVLRRLLCFCYTLHDALLCLLFLCRCVVS